MNFNINVLVYLTIYIPLFPKNESVRTKPLFQSSRHMCLFLKYTNDKCVHLLLWTDRNSFNEFTLTLIYTFLETMLET